jgi:two-component system sensor histidine kinase YesM
LIAQYNYFFLLLTIVVLVVIAAFFRIIKYLVNEPMQRMIGAFERVNRGAFDLQLEYHRHDDFRYLYDGFNRMINRIHLLITQVYEQRILAQEATLKQLQYQISPHFLYNTLSVLYQTIKFGDDEKALHMARGLNEYYRYVVKNRDNLVTLESEMEHVRNYVDIQGMRHGERITVAIDEVPESVRSFKVPILIVQPVVENAYKHGLKDVEDHGMIRVSIADSESRVEISVEDNGESLSRTQLADLRRQMDSPGLETDRTGLMNVHRRLRIKYGTESGVGISRSALGGLRVMLEFQKEQL